VVVNRARVLSSEHGVGSGVKVDGEPPLPALRPPPGAAVGQGVGWGPRGSLPDPARPGPICEKSRFQDVKPLCSTFQAFTNCG
jgi:hypothetical protein